MQLGEHLFSEKDYELYEAIYKTEIVFVVDFNGTIKHASPAAEEKFLYEPKGMLGVSIFNAISENQLFGIKKFLAAIAADEKPENEIEITIPIKSRTGVELFGKVRAIIFLDKKKNEKLILLKVTDISELYHAQNELKKAFEEIKSHKNQLQAILDNSVSMICAFDSDGKFIQVSKSCESLLGYKPYELIGKKFDEFLFEEDLQNTKLVEQDLRNGKKNNNLTNRYKRKDGTLITLEWIGSWNESENVLYSIASDASEKNKAKKERNLLLECAALLSNSKSDLNDTLNRLARLIAVNLNADRCHIILPQGSTENLQEKGGWVNPENKLKQKSPPLVEVAKQLRVGENFDYNTIILPTKKADNDLHFLSIPISLNNTVGVIILGSPNTQALKGWEKDMGFIKILANQISSDLKRTQIDRELKNFFDLTPEILCIFSKTGDIRKINNAIEPVLGYSRKEALNLNLYNLIAKENKLVVLRELVAIRQGKQVETFEAQFICKSGEIKWLLLTIFHQSSDEVFYVTANDISDKKEQEQAVKKAAERYENILENNPSGILTINRDYFITSANSSLASFLRVPQKTLIGANLCKLYSSFDDSPFYLALEESFNDSSSIKFESFFEPLNLWLEITAYPMDDELTILVREITDRKLQEKLLLIETQVLERNLGQTYNLKETLDYLLLEVEKLFKGLKCSILKFDSRENGLVHLSAPSLPEGYVKNIGVIQVADNMGSCGTAAYKKELVIVSDIENDPKWIPAKPLAKEHNLKSCWSFPIYGNNEVWATFANYYEEKKEPKEVEIKILQQVANLVKMLFESHFAKEEQEKLNAAILQKNEDLEQFSFVTSHNLRSPLSNLMGLLSLYNHENPADEFNKTIIESLTESAEHLNQILTEVSEVLLVKNNPEETNKKLIIVEDLFKRVCESIKKDIELAGAQIKVSSSLNGVLLISPRVLNSLFLNLLTNSLRYKKEHENLLISVDLKLEETTLHIVFSDNGKGIDLEKYGDRIFGLYQRFSNHKESRGVGLYLVKTQLEAIGGKISVESKINEGTTFKIKIPLDFKK
jgi:PAS domain S-box-containing protein